ncbi:MAG: S-methyl-5-thioribose-1-phosphate isomerase [Candidatus Auribacterota bacterium]
MPVPTILWENEELTIIDQTKLPLVLDSITLKTVEDVWDAIQKLRVRGAPAIGVAAALGVIVGIRNFQSDDRTALVEKVKQVADYLATSRPTAVNLFWALDRMKAVCDRYSSATAAELMIKLKREAVTILEEDKLICRAIGRSGNELVPDDSTILTHCNAGGLATVDYGTALGVIYAAYEAGKNITVYADETRPLLQGSRLTAWELKESGIPVTLICDNTAAKVMHENKIDLVIVGADRIAANGDTANKIGTYMVAVLAKAHGIPFYVAAPSSTFDFSLSSGERIPIEERDPIEVVHGMGKQTAPDGIKVYSPAFDVTPANLITAFITEKGNIFPPFTENIRSTIGTK